MEEFDLITDSFAGEGVALLIAERIWSRYQVWRDAKDEKEKQEEQDKDQNDKLSDIRETLGGMKETQDLFKRYIGKKL